MSTYNIICAGFGGQGILFLGKMLAEAAMREGKNVSWIPSYGPEMRGGTANVSVVISDKQIGSPVVANPNILIAMNRPSLEKFEPLMESGGTLLYNKTLIEITPKRDDINVIAAEVTKTANELGNVKLSNIVALGSLIAKNPVVKEELVIEALKEILVGKKAKLLDLNLKALKKGKELV